MLRGIDTATSGMIALQRRMDTLTNNLANEETPGYKQDASLLRSFPQMLLNSITNQASTGNNSLNTIGSLSVGVYNQETLPLFSQGDLVSTNLPFDVAIDDRQLPSVQQNNQTLKPSAFFVAQSTDGGYHLTRNGRFSTNDNGQLITSTGDLVLDQSGAPISDPELPSGDIVINEKGDIILHSDNAALSKKIASIGMMIVENPNQLVKEGNGYFQMQGFTPSMMAKTLPNGMNLQHKMIEQSNVDLSQSMTDIMANIRLYEANQKVLQAYDKTLEQLNTVGRG